MDKTKKERKILNKSEIFILESMDAKSRKNGYLEGRILYHILKMRGYFPVYKYVKTKSELISAAEWFKKSKCRYLHIATHGSDKSIALENESITYEDFAKCFYNMLDLKRVFCAACCLGNSYFLEALRAQHNTGLHSLVAHVDNVILGECVAYWAMFYMSIGLHSDTAMNYKTIKSKISQLSYLNRINTVCFYYNPKRKSCVEHIYKGKA